MKSKQTTKRGALWTAPKNFITTDSSTEGGNHFNAFVFSKAVSRCLIAICLLLFSFQQQSKAQCAANATSGGFVESNFGVEDDFYANIFALSPSTIVNNGSDDWFGN